MPVLWDKLMTKESANKDAQKVLPASSLFPITKGSILDSFLLAASSLCLRSQLKCVKTCFLSPAVHNHQKAAANSPHFYSQQSQRKPI